MLIIQKDYNGNREVSKKFRTMEENKYTSGHRCSSDF